jgi:hypothetical protein
MKAILLLIVFVVRDLIIHHTDELFAFDNCGAMKAFRISYSDSCYASKDTREVSLTQR